MLKLPTRSDLFAELFPSEPHFRQKQLEQAGFNPKLTKWKDLTSLPLKMRTVVQDNIPWNSVKEKHFYPSKNGDTYKSILKAIDGQLFETY